MSVPETTRIPCLPPVMSSLKSLTGASGMLSNVVTSWLSTTLLVPVSVSFTPFSPISGITSLGSVLMSRPDLGSLRTFLTKYTGPVSG